jgi:hypothetical protein
MHIKPRKYKNTFNIKIKSLNIFLAFRSQHGDVSNYGYLGNASNMLALVELHCGRGICAKVRGERVNAIQLDME